MGRIEINARVINKHDTEANWNNHSNFIPNKSEIIVYDKDDNYNYPRVKIGDGVTNVNLLPFLNEVISNDEIDIICSATVETPTNGLTSEDWIFTLSDGSTLTKKVVVVE